MRRYQVAGKKVRDSIYQLFDNFTLFCLRYADENAGEDPHFWTTSVGSPLESTWAGLSFELVCLEHVEQVKRALQVGGVHSRNYAWRCERPEDDFEKGAQIDLVLDRDDGVLNVCEMKFCGKQYAIKEVDDLSVRNKKAAFRRETGTRKAIHVTYVTTFGLVRNAYANSVQSEVSLDDLFRV